jgi:hypothetical protein
MTQQVAVQRLKGGWAFKALTPEARNWFLETMRLPFQQDGDIEVFIQNVSDANYDSWMQVFKELQWSTDKPPVDVSQYEL